MKVLDLAGSALALVFVSATAAAAFPATSTVSTNVRSGPGAHYKVVDHIPPNASVDAGPCQGGWCRVDGSGWVKQSLLASAAPAYPSTYYAYNEPYYYDDYYDDDYPFDDGPFFFGFHHHGFHGHHGNHGGHGHGFPGHGVGPGHASGSHPIITGRASAFGPAPGMSGHFEGGGFGHGGGHFGGGGFGGGGFHGGGHVGGGGFGGGAFHGGGGGGHR